MAKNPGNIVNTAVDAVAKNKEFGVIGSLRGGGGVDYSIGAAVEERWSYKFGPCVKVNCTLKRTIYNDQEKTPFSRV